MNKPIIINQWKKGIGQSSAEGFQDMRNCDPFRKPGYLEVSTDLNNEADVPRTRTFTVNAGTDVVTTSATMYRDSGDNITSQYRAVTVSSTVTLPSPLAAATTYFITVSPSSSTTFKLSTTLANAIAGTAIDITDTGTGVHTMTTVNMSTPKYMAYSSLNDAGASGTAFYLQDSAGKIWWRSSANGFWVLITGNTSSSQGQGLAVWKNYLFAFGDTKIDVYNIASPTWSNDWQPHGSSPGLSSLTDHVPFVSADGIMYFYSKSSTGSYHSVGSLQELTTFAPGTSASYTYNVEALDINDGITSFEDLGDNLMIGTNASLIYPWDRTSTSFNNPVKLLESYVQCMRTLNNILYFSAGVNGNIYYTYGTTVEKLLDMPDELVQTLRYPAIVKNIFFSDKELLFILDSGGTTTPAVSGIYSLNLKDGAFHIKYKFSQGYTIATQSNAAEVSFTGTTGPVFFVGYAVSGVAYIDSTNAFNNTFNTVGAYGAYAITDLYEIGDLINPRTLQKMQIILARPLVSGEGVRISSRKNLTDSFTEVATFDFATIGSETAWDSVINIQKAQFIQFKIELSAQTSQGSVSSSTYNTPTLKSLIIY